MRVSVRSDVKKLERRLTAIQRKQIPFATSQAINDASFAAQRELKKQAPRKLDRPTRFTVNAFRVGKATKKTLKGKVFIVPKVWEYLRWQILGGTARKGGAGFGVPVNAKLNKFGNIPGRQKGLIKNKRQYVDMNARVPGIYERVGGKKSGKRRLIIAFEKTTKYRPRFSFHKIVDKTVKGVFPKAMKKRLSAALRSAR